jgi:hypothetical protein
MASEICGTCGLPLAGHVCPSLPEGVIRRGTALIKPLELRKMMECPHCGRAGGHNNDDAATVAFKCGWYSYSLHIGLNPAARHFAPYTLEHLNAFAAYLASSGKTWEATPPRVKAEKPDKPKRVKMAPKTEDATAAPITIACAKCGVHALSTELASRHGALYCRACVVDIDKDSIAASMPEHAPTAPTTEAPVGTSMVPPSKPDMKRLKAMLAGKA